MKNEIYKKISENGARESIVNLMRIHKIILPNDATLANEIEWGADEIMSLWAADELTEIFESETSEQFDFKDIPTLTKGALKGLIATVELDVSICKEDGCQPIADDFYKILERLEKSYDTSPNLVKQYDRATKTPH